MSTKTKYNLQLPRMGESVDEATIVSWLKEVGDEINVDDFVVEIATDKVDSEVPSDVRGKLIEKCFEVNDVVKVGETICVIELSDDVERVEEKIIDNIPNIDLIIPKEEQENATKSEKKENNDKSEAYFSPLVRSIANKENISDQELENIVGSGKNNRLTKRDLLEYLDSNKKLDNSSASKAEYNLSNQTSRDLTRMEKVLAEHMVNSKKTSPHVQSFIEVDVTELWNWREKVKNDFFEKTGQKITITHVITKIVSELLAEFPILNSSLVNDKVIIKKEINVGVATALKDGNLIVPVIKNCDQLSLVGIVNSMNKLIQNARTNNLSPDDVFGGTYTITNVGVFGTLAGTPIINQPQVGILAIGSIEKKPSVIETNKGDFIGVRRKMILSHSYDHRIINGATGGLFIKRLKEILESWDSNTMI